MALYAIGQTIREYRKRRKISQDSLCYGLCDITTLSRIERGVQNPSKKVAEALLQRLGLEKELFNIQVSTTDITRANIERLISDKLAKQDTNISELLAQYRDAGSEMSNLERQYYEFVSTFSVSEETGESGETEKRLVEALRLSIPDFDESFSIENHYFSVTELLILNALAIEKRKTDLNQGIELLLRLVEVFEKQNTAIEDMEKHYPAILANLTSWLHSSGDYKKGYEMAEKGMNFCIEHGKLTILPHLVYDRGVFSILLGNKEEGRRFVLESLVLMKIMGQQDVIRNTMDYVNSILGPEMAIKIEEIY